VSDVGLVPGVLSINAILLAVGYALLSCALRGQSLQAWSTFAGVALLVGAASTFCALTALSVTELPLGADAFLVASLALIALGIVAGRVLSPTWRARMRPTLGPARSPGAIESGIATAAAVALVSVVVLVVIGGFRSTPTLDDTWTMWLPKGRLLGSVGLDSRFFLEGTAFQPFASPDHPFWWSLATNTVVTAAGGLNLRAVDAEVSILLAGFVGATCRLLWDHVRPALLLTGLLLLALAPELIRQTQGGGADVPLAIYLVMFVLVAGRWLIVGDRFALALSIPFAAAALTMKKDGGPELVAFALVLSAFRIRSARARVGWLWLALGAGLAFALPAIVWMAAHGVRGEIPIADFVSPSHLSDQAERVGPAMRTLASHLFSVDEWPLLLPLFLAANLAVALYTRNGLWLLPATLLLVGYALLVWVTWADPLDLTYRLGVASRRMVLPVALLAGVGLPILAEALTSAWREARRPARASPAPPRTSPATGR
jgi:hypothetical protein